MSNNTKLWDGLDELIDDEDSVYYVGAYNAEEGGTQNIALIGSGGLLYIITNEQEIILNREHQKALKNLFSCRVLEF